MIKTKTYQNGMKLVVETNPNALSSECLFHFNVGALNEREYEQGYAHFLEQDGNFGLNQLLSLLILHYQICFQIFSSTFV